MTIETTLVFDYLRFVEEFQPASVLIENVPGLVSFAAGDTSKSVLGELEALGYQADVRILYAPHYGVPQTRWRTVVIGSRAFEPALAFPEPSHYAAARVNFTSRFRDRSLVHLPDHKGLQPCPTVRQAISDLPILENGELGEPSKRCGRANPDGLASTILTKCDPHWGAHFHYEQARAFTVRESARLQTFPDRYSFAGSRVAQYEQVGNAVPPFLARAVGNALLAELEVATPRIATAS